VSHAASGQVPVHVLRTSRAWDEPSWSSAVDDLRARGLLTADADPTFTEEGAAQRGRIEASTDARSAPAYAALGEDGCRRLRELAKPMARAAYSAFVLPTGFL
jgi:hypothetical protein